MKHEPLVIERVLQAPVSRVWRAITDKDEMHQWYFKLSDFSPVVGFEFQFEGKNEGRTFMHLCKITEVVSEKKLQYSWRYLGHEGISYVTFELFPEGDKTRLKLTHEGLESFPDTADFRRSNFVAGWTALIGDRLPSYLGGRL